MMARYRAMDGEAKYLGLGPDLWVIGLVFREHVGGAVLEEGIHDTTKEPFVVAFSPIDGELVGTLYGATLKEYQDATSN